MRFLILLFSLVFIMSSCGDSGTSEAKTDTTKTDKTETPAEPDFKYALTPFAPSTAFEDAKIEQIGFSGKTFSFKLAEGTSYELGAQTPDAAQKNCANSDQGQHIHVLIDDQPYAARYTAKFDDVEITPGEHLMLAFLSRSYHESIKTPGAHKAMKISATDKGATFSNLTEPMIWYSRPKGNYKGKANTDKVMLDFYLVNTTLSGGKKVKADINGEIHMIDTWQPYYIKGLPMGNNKITLSLLNADGSLVDAPQNPISREFTLEVDPTEM